MPQVIQQLLELIGDPDGDLAGLFFVHVLTSGTSLSWQFARKEVNHRLPGCNRHPLRSLVHRPRHPSRSVRDEC